MEINFAPNSADDPNLLYKLQRKIKVFNTTDALRNRGYNLIASSSKYGLVFIASPDGTLSAYYLQQLADKDCASPLHFEVKLPEKPTHISVSCDQELLAVTGGQIIWVFQLVNFQSQNVKPSISMKTDVNPTVAVSALQWNPCIPDTMALAFIDGTLLVAQANSGQVKKVQAKARCICWSPKGKQLVVGNSDGTLTQFKPDLSPMKSVPAPNIFNGSPVEVEAIYWISTYQFCVVFRNAADNSRPAVAIVNTPKGGQLACLNYEDICYSIGSSRPWYYYLVGVPQWNLILAASSNSMEIATLGSADGANWIQWTQSDEARPELPFTDKKQENYPVGICIDTAAIHQLPWGENEVLPYMPQLLVVSQTGVLSIFNVINIRNGAPQICAPPQTLALPQTAMTTEIPGEAPIPAPADTPQQQEAAPSQVAAPSQPAPFVAPVVQQPSNNQGFQAISSLPNQSQEPVPGPAPIVIPKPQPAQTPQNPSQTPQNPSQTPQNPSQTPQNPSQTPQNPPQTPQNPAQTPQNPSQTPEATAALRAEQERVNLLKANEELKNILLKELNDFQGQLYGARVKTRELQLQIQDDLNSLNVSFDLHSLDSETLRKACSLEELRAAVVQLKLELVRACAVIAEARSHSDAGDHQWSQTDPLTSKQLASVKKLAYYVHNQLQQAHRALDHKWNEMAAKDAQFNKPGTFMIRPILDEVYQPLVKQQEILHRQQAVLKSLQKTLTECDAAPVFKSTSLLRNTPFKKDPLSKLTKNILNMSIEQKDRLIDNGLSNQKLEALRDMLSNQKTVKIKPVNIELSKHLAAMKLNYEKSLKEKPVKLELAPVVKVEVPGCSKDPVPLIKRQIKPEKLEPLNVPQYGAIESPIGAVKPTSGMAGVARTLFTEETKQEPMQTPTPTQSKPFGFPPADDKGGNSSIPKVPSANPTNDMPSEATRSVLKNLLMNKQENNTFMGQKICSPSAFGPPPNQPGSSAFTSKPISDISNMMSKYQPQPPFASLKTHDPPKMKSLETGEPEESGEVVIIDRKDKAVPFNVKNVPDLVKPNVTISVVDKKPEKAKEKETKPFSISASLASGSSQSANVPLVIPKPKPTKPEANKHEKDEAKATAKTTAPETQPTETKTTTTSIFGSSQPFSSTTTGTSSVFGAKTQTPSIFGANNNKDSPPLSVFGSNKTEPASPSAVFASAKADSASPASVFGSSKKTESPTPTSIFGSASKTENDTPSSVFGSTSKTEPASPGSVFGTAKTENSNTESTTPASIFAAVSKAETAAASSGSVFASASKTETSTPASVFGSTKTNSTASPSSVFGSAKTESPTPASVFGAATKTENAAPASVFGASKTESASPASVFGSANKTEPASPSTVFGPAKTEAPTPASVFGSANKTESPTPASVFGSTKTDPASPASVFGSATKPETASPASVFGAAKTESPTPASVFGSATKTETTQSAFGSTPQSVFGTATTASAFATTTTSQSIFGTAPATTQASIFGSPSSQSSVFGTTTTQSVFGTPATQASVFGATTQASVFGAPTSTTQASVFGTAAPGFGSPATTQTSIFGSPPATQSSAFGATSPSQSVFGAATTQPSIFGGTTQASVFGSTSPSTPFGAPATTSSSVFGESNLFASASISTTSASQSGGNIFGGSTTSFGGSPQNVFGQAAPAASVFGGSPAFGQKPATNLWAGGTTASSGFGTPFGQQTTTQAQSSFGTGSFSANASPGQAFSSPTQPASVFGSPQQTATQGGFGGSPAFGSKPAFGQATGFGSPSAFGQPAFGGSAFSKSPSGGFGASAAFGSGATFGGAPAFGSTSPGKVFGGAAPGFAAQTQSNATFESLATQDTLTFGNLAQQSGPAQPAAPTFNSSPSFTGWRG